VPDLTLFNQGLWTNLEIPSRKGGAFGETR